MKLANMRFRAKDTDGKIREFGWRDIFGYEGEVCGVFARIQTPDIHDLGGDIDLTYNSGYGFKGINGDLEIEVFEAKEG